jgi:hypothetical protein
MGKWDTYYDDTAFLLPPALPDHPNGGVFYGDGTVEAIPAGLTAPDANGWRYDDAGHIFKPGQPGISGGHLFWNPATGNLWGARSGTVSQYNYVQRPVLSQNQRMCWRPWQGWLQRSAARSVQMVATGAQLRGRPAWMAVCTVAQGWTPYLLAPWECGRSYPEWPPFDTLP